MFYNVFRTQFPTCGKWSFPMGKVKEMDNRKCILKTFSFPMETERFSCKVTKMYPFSIVNYNVFGTRNPTPQTPMKTNVFGYLSGPWESRLGLKRRPRTSLSRISPAPGNLVYIKTKAPDLSLRHLPPRNLVYEGGGVLFHALPSLSRISGCPQKSRLGRGGY